MGGRWGAVAACPVKKKNPFKKRKPRTKKNLRGGLKKNHKGPVSRFVEEGSEKNRRLKTPGKRIRLEERRHVRGMLTRNKPQSRGRGNPPADEGKNNGEGGNQLAI